MRLSTRTRYGARALAELAAAYGNGTMSVRDMARRQQVSAKYLEQIMGALRAGGLVEAERGTRGGYALARPPEQIRLSEVFHLLEGSAAPVACVDSPSSCPMEGGCPTRGTWTEIRDAIERVLARTTLRELADRMEAGRESGTPMYCI